MEDLREHSGEDTLIFGMQESLWEEVSDKMEYAGLDGFVPLPFFVSRLEKGIERVEKKRQDTLENNKELRLSGMRLLCAEDNELNAEILAAMLEMKGTESLP